MGEIEEFLKNGDGYGSGDGSGSGSGYGYGIKSFCGKEVYLIDGMQTIIESVRGNIAHGNTLREAFEALQEKLYDENTEDERLQKFREHFPDFSAKYPARELFTWHHVLTGSCKAGREAFCHDNGIDIENDTFTIHEFVALTRNSYGGETIEKLLETD